MSQAGIVDIEGSHPQIPTLFVADVGSAVPIANTLEILGSAVTAHGVPLQTVGSGNTITIDVQYASAAVGSVAANAGVASFNSADFTVDASGFVALTALAGATKIGVDASTPPGTDPVDPNGSGVITVTGAQVAAGTTANVIRTDSLALNTVTIEIQRSQSVASSTVADNGVCHFDSSSFTVDSNGWVTLRGGSQAIDSFHPNSGTDPVVPTTAGLVNMLGAGSITTVGSLNTLTTQLTGITNHAVQVGAGDGITLTQVSPSTSGFVLTSNGAAADPSFQAVSASGAIITITGNSGGAESPSAGNFNILGTGSITVVGSANTETIQLTGLTNHSLLVGAGTATITNLGVATNGQLPIGSTGANPVLATLTAGTGISISNAAGSITISTVGSGFTWVDNSGTFTASINTGYFLTAASTVTLPASPAQGDAVSVVCDTTGSCVVTANTGQSIRISNQLSSVAGTATNTARGDTLSLVYRSATTTWFADASPNGGWTTA